MSEIHLGKDFYDNYEIIVVENNSEEKDTFAYYEMIQHLKENIRVITWKREFNYAAINNFAVSYAQGEYLLFLNNDVEIITKGWIEEMLDTASGRMLGSRSEALLS